MGFSEIWVEDAVLTFTIGTDDYPIVTNTTGLTVSLVLISQSGYGSTVLATAPGAAPSVKIPLSVSLKASGIIPGYYTLEAIADLGGQDIPILPSESTDNPITVLVTDNKSN